MLRLALSAELSAAAGALEDQRPDVAADLVGGASLDLQELRANVARQRARELEPALAGAGPEARTQTGEDTPTDDAPIEPAIPHARRGVGLGNWQGRILAGALAIGLALMVLPHSGSGRTPSQPRAAQPQVHAVNVTLVSSEFSTLRETLQSKSPAAASVLAAGRSWHTAVARSLHDASTHATTATQIVELLREERALLATPAMGTPKMREAALQLTKSADDLFSRLRALASSQVLAVLPTVLTALPISATPVPAQPSEAPAPSTAPTPASTPSPAQEDTPVSPATPQPTFATPTTPAPTTSPSPALPIPLQIPLPSLPPLPDIISHLGGLTGLQQTTGNTDTTGSSDPSATDSLSASTQDTLNALGLGS